MAISSYPTPADAGVLCIILANTAISISIVKEIVRSILHVIGIRIASWEELELSVDRTDSSSWPYRSPSESYMDEFRTQIPATRYGSIFICKQDCSICLSEFESNEEVNCLLCSHVFHKSCLEKWLKHWNKTCPLCRKHMMMFREVEEDSCPM